MKLNGYGPLFQLKPRRYSRRGYLPFGGGPGALPTVLAAGS